MPNAKNKNIGTATYLDLISKDAKKKDNEQLNFDAQEAKHTVDVSVLETKRAIFKAKKDLANAQCAKPYDLQVEINLLNRIESLESGLVLAEQIQSTRFA